MPQPRSSPPLTPIKLVAFDVDGTLLRGQTICECIAAGIGRQDEMRAIERLITVEDITAARAEMISWYRHHDMSTLLRLVQTVTLAPGAREGVAALKHLGVRVALVSITWQFALDWLASELGADLAVGTRWCEDDTIAHFWPADKATWLAECAAKFSLQRAEIAAVGNSKGDVPMLCYAGTGYFVGPDRQDLPPHVRHWPDGNIAEIVRDMFPDLPPSQP